MSALFCRSFADNHINEHLMSKTKHGIPELELERFKAMYPDHFPLGPLCVKLVSAELEKNPDSIVIYSNNNFLFTLDEILALFKEKTTSWQGTCLVWGFTERRERRLQYVERMIYHVREFLTHYQQQNMLEDVFTVHDLVCYMFGWCQVPSFFEVCFNIKSLRHPDKYWKHFKLSTLHNKYSSLRVFTRFLGRHFGNETTKAYATNVASIFGIISNNCRKESVLDRDELKWMGQIQYPTLEDIKAWCHSDEHCYYLSLLESPYWLEKFEGICEERRREVIFTLSSHVLLLLLFYSGGGRPEGITRMRIQNVKGAQPEGANVFWGITTDDKTARTKKKKKGDAWFQLVSNYMYNMLDRLCELQKKYVGSNDEDYLFTQKGTGDLCISGPQARDMINRSWSSASEVRNKRILAYDIRRGSETHARKVQRDGQLLACLARYLGHTLQIAEDSYNLEPRNRLDAGDISAWDKTYSQLRTEEVIASRRVAVLMIESLFFGEAAYDRKLLKINEGRECHAIKNSFFDRVLTFSEIKQGYLLRQEVVKDYPAGIPDIGNATKVCCSFPEALVPDEPPLPEPKLQDDLVDLSDEELFTADSDSSSCEDINEVINME